MSEKFAVPLAIIIAGGLIAGAVYYASVKSPKNLPAAQVAATTDQAVGTMRPVTSDDHILGNPNAQVVIVEYSDPECPFCKAFHPTLQQIMAQYGASGQVAWVYRHFPIAELHPKAPKEAEAFECAWAQGGNDMFWKYADAVYATTNSNNSLDDGVYNVPATPPLDANGQPAYVQKPPRSKTDAGQLSDIAKSLGLNVATFEDCLAKGTYAAKVQADYQDALAAGGKGTPNSILISKDGTKTDIAGNVPYASLKATIDALLGK